MKRKNTPALKKIAIAFAIVLVAIGLYIKIEPHTHDAKIRAELESKTHQLIETRNQLEQTNQKTETQQKELQELNQKLQETEKALQAKKSIPKAYAEAQPAYKPTGDKNSWLAASGIPSDQWWAVDFIVDREAGWNPCAYNPGRSDCGYEGQAACGLAQALPCSKLRNYGCTMTDAVCHLKWQYEYVTGRYGGYPQAYAFWQVNHWY